MNKFRLCQSEDLNINFRPKVFERLNCLHYRRINDFLIAACEETSALFISSPLAAPQHFFTSFSASGSARAFPQTTSRILHVRDGKTETIKETQRGPKSRQGHWGRKAAESRLHFYSSMICFKFSVKVKHKHDFLFIYSFIYFFLFFLCIWHCFSNKHGRK